MRHVTRLNVSCLAMFHVSPHVDMHMSPPPSLDPEGPAPPPDASSTSSALVPVPGSDSESDNESDEEA